MTGVMAILGMLALFMVVFKSVVVKLLLAGAVVYAVVRLIDAFRRA